MGQQASRLRFPATLASDGYGLVNRVTRADAGWSMLSVEIHRLRAGEEWARPTEDCEAVLVLLSGKACLASGARDWGEVGGRTSVFDGMPWSLYASRDSDVRLKAHTDVEFAFAWVPVESAHPSQLVRPQDVRIVTRGGHSNTRQINEIVPPGFDCERLVCVEVFTPSGNWSSYPPHKHDTHEVGADGQLVEGDLEEFYCYKFAKAGGWAFQRIYTDDRSTDEAVVAEDGDVVLVPYGYHPVAAAYGYDCYYLNFLAGSAQTLACRDDPAHSWVKETWNQTDPRVPMVGREPA